MHCTVFLMLLLFNFAFGHVDKLDDPSNSATDIGLDPSIPSILSLQRAWKKIAEKNYPSTENFDHLTEELRKFNNNFLYFSNSIASSTQDQMEALNDKLHKLSEKNTKSNEEVIKHLNSITSFIIWSHATRCNLTNHDILDYSSVAASILDEYEKSLLKVIHVDEKDCLLKVDKQCFTYHVDKLTWSDARKFCKVRGGDLASGDHYSKLVAITRNERSTGKNFSTYMWMGASDFAEENVWVWVNGESLDKLDGRWGEDDPDYGDADHCLGVGTRKIYDRYCDDLNSFICELTLT